MTRSRFRISHVCSCVLLMAVVSAHAACGGDEDNAAPGGGQAGQDDAGATPGTVADASDVDKEDGEVVTEDGDIPEVIPEDAAAEEVGPDGGLIFQPGCASVTPGPYVDTTCTDRLPTFTSTGLVAGTYELTSVRVLGSKTFCANDFKVFEHAGALVVTATSQTEGALRFYERYRSKANPLVTAVHRYQVAATVDGTDVTFGAPTCAAGAPAPATARFGSGEENGKKFVLLRLPYGASGSAVYRFEEL